MSNFQLLVISSLLVVSATSGSVLQSLAGLGLDLGDSGEHSATEASDESSEESFSRGGRLFGAFGSLLGLGSGPNCGPPDACPPHACRFDPAVIHGFCCGCASPYDRVPIVCPGNLQCPLYGERLCSDYDYMMDCCC